jgi:hypothetical protein
MAPLATDQVEVEVSDIWPVLAMTDLGNLAAVIALDLPDRGWSIALDDKEQPGEFRIGGQMRLRYMMLAIPGLRLDQGMRCLAQNA